MCSVQYPFLDTGWIEEEVLEQTGCSFQVDKFQQLSGLIYIVSDVGVLKVVSAFWLSRVRISGARASFFQLEALVSGRINKGSASRGSTVLNIVFMALFSWHDSLHSFCTGKKN